MDVPGHSKEFQPILPSRVLILVSIRIETRSYFIAPPMDWGGREIPPSLWESLALEVSTKGSRSKPVFSSLGTTMSFHVYKSCWARRLKKAYVAIGCELGTIQKELFQEAVKDIARSSPSNWKELFITNTRGNLKHETWKGWTIQHYWVAYLAI